MEAIQFPNYSPEGMNQTDVIGVRRFGRLCSSACILFGFLSTHLMCIGAPPTLKAIHPTGAKQGETATLEMVGTMDPVPGQVWISDEEGIEWELVDGESMKFKIVVGAGARIGPHWIRLVNRDGASDPALFWVEAGWVNRLDETEPNDPPAEDAVAITQEQLKTGVALYGRLNESEDVDHIPVSLEKGQTFVADLYCYRLGAPMDPLIHIMDSNFFPLDFNHDQDDLLNLDPRLVFTAPETGTYWLQIAGFANPPQSRIRFFNDPAAVYRLLMSVGPFLNAAIPAVQTNDSSPVIHRGLWLGWNVDQQTRRSGLELVRIRRPASEDDLMIPQSISGAATVPWFEGAALFEIENENLFSGDAAPMAVPVPCLISGRMNYAGDKDTFLFEAEKDQSYTIEAHSRRLGFFVDTRVSIVDGDGKLLVSSDDIAKESPDSRLDWKAPADGWQSVVVEDVFENSGESSWYALSIQIKRPSIQFHASPLQVSIAPGETKTFEIAIERKNGAEGVYRLYLDPLPEGVSGSLVTVTKDTKKAQITLTADAKAGLANRPVYLKSFQEGATQGTVTAWHPVTGLTTESGEMISNSIEELWLTVKPAPEEKKEEKKE